MRPLVLFFALLCFIPHSRAGEAQPVVRPDIPAVYTVKKGDTLWDISAHFLLNPWLWPKLWQANSYIENPHLIYPGDQLHLIWVDGQPQLRLKRTVKLSPSIRVKRSPITTLQESLVFPYLVEHKLLTPESLESLPRILGSSSRQRYLSPGDALWVDAPVEKDTLFWVYRPVTEFSREEKLAGDGGHPRVQVLEKIAKVRGAEVEGDRSRVTVESLRQEIRQNDVLLPAPPPGTELDLSFVPSAPPVDVEARVLGHLTAQNYIAIGQIVVLDRGHLDQVAAGNIFQLYREGTKVRGKKGDYRYQDNSAFGEPYQLGAVAIGELMVVRPYEYFSLAVVVQATEPFRAGVSALPPVTVR